MSYFSWKELIANSQIENKKPTLHRNNCILETIATLLKIGQQKITIFLYFRENTLF